MGYTHYFNRPLKFPGRQFERAAADCEKVVKHLCQKDGLKVQFEFDDPNPPSFHVNAVQFNGVGEEGHETFYVPRVFDTDGRLPPRGRGEGWFDFCKTAHKPYDAAACACLVVFRRHFGGRFTVRSDGDDDSEGWARAREACQTVLGYGSDFSLLVNERLTTAGLGRQAKKFERKQAGIDEITLNNGWDLRRCRSRFSRTMYSLKAPARYWVVDPTVRETEKWDYGQKHMVNGPADGVVASGPDARTAVWRATCVWLGRLFPDAPEVVQFVEAASAAVGDWTPLRVWRDLMEERGYDKLNRYEALLPKRVFSPVAA